MDFLPEFVNTELKKVEKIIAASCQSKNPLITEAALYTFNGGGKRLRPAIIVLTSRGFGYEDTSHLKVAAALELLHTATLLHDDVIDGASYRRGRKSVNAKWGNDIAILVADFLYSQAFSLAVESIPDKFLNILTQTSSQMCEGEVLEIQKRGSMLKKEDYLEIIRCKTAQLFSACTALAAIVARASEDSIRKIAGFGLNFGLAFQITDDTLDFIANDNKWGKEIGQDFLKDQQTLPLIRTLELATNEERKKILQISQNGHDLSVVLEYIKKYDSINYSLDLARKYSSKAISKIKEIPDLKYRSSFIDLSEFAANRSH